MEDFRILPENCARYKNLEKYFEKITRNLFFNRFSKIRACFDSKTIYIFCQKCCFLCQNWVIFPFFLKNKLPIIGNLPFLGTKAHFFCQFFPIYGNYMVSGLEWVLIFENPLKNGFLMNIFFHFLILRPSSFYFSPLLHALWVYDFFPFFFHFLSSSGSTIEKKKKKITTSGSVQQKSDRWSTETDNCYQV